MPNTKIIVETEQECVESCLELPQCLFVTYVEPNPPHYDSTVNECYRKSGDTVLFTSSYTEKMVAVNVNCVRKKCKFSCYAQ